MRLDRFLSDTTGLSRAQARQAIRAGAVTVDGVPARDPARHIADHSRVGYAGRELIRRGPRYYMLHKPAGYVCSTADPDHPTVLALLPPEERAGLHPAGRLDLDATGLVLLSDDGQWSHRITAPRRGCAKTYRVVLAEPLPADAVQRLRQGLLLHGEDQPTRPAELVPESERVARLTVYEGRYHQVKRMFAALGNRVLALHRERIGGIALDSALGPGQYRALTADEIASVDRP
ncbi:MAG TPA: 16S rRNA pseudouridine(516) synthase RsuA [Candidatus Competibacteraceae bacterium]|nr:16S rRNA pseudouridine(516) synthase RsuA [Candidatus Competibacteraceae bacterium]